MAAENRKAACRGGLSGIHDDHDDCQRFTSTAPRLQHLTEHLHRLGPRATHEFIFELVTRFGPEVIQRLDAYGRIDAGILRALGGDRHPPRIFVVNGARR